MILFKIRFFGRKLSLIFDFINVADFLFVTFSGSPMLIDVQDVVQVLAKGPGLQYAHIGKEAVFHVAPFGTPYITDLKILIRGGQETFIEVQFTQIKLS